MSQTMLNDELIMDDINPLVDPKNFFPSGTSKHLLDFQKYKAPEHEEGQKEYVSPACGVLSKGVGRPGFRADECALSRPLIPGRNIDRGFTVTEKKEIQKSNGNGNGNGNNTELYTKAVSIACLLLLIVTL